MTDERGDRFGVPVEDDDQEASSARRRAASAEFVVESRAGSAALLREAMDPANKSLQDALRLSYRVLQIVMLVLVVVFVFSGVKQVDSGQTGVMLRWGRVIGDSGEQALDAGAHFNWFPYPAGEFVLVDESERRVDLGDWFWPRLSRGQTVENALETFTQHNHIRPGVDGALLCANGDIAHLKLRGSYEIIDPVAFLENIENEAADEFGFDADRLVTLAMKRAVVHVAAQRGVDDFVDFNEEKEDTLRTETQRFLDSLNVGIRVAQLEAPESARPAFAAARAINEAQQAIQNVKNVVQLANRGAEKVLIDQIGSDGTTGEGARLLALIEQYQSTYDAGGADAARSLLDQIHEILESEAITGSVTSTIQFAKSYESQVELTLGADVKRFNGLLESYRLNPERVIQQRWAQAFAEVVRQPDAHVVYVPDGVGNFLVKIEIPNDLAEIRRDQRLEEKERGTVSGFLQESAGRFSGVGDINTRRGPGRQLPVGDG